MSSAPAAAPATDPKAKPKKKGKTKLFLMIGVVLLLAGGGGWYFFLRAKPVAAKAVVAKAEGVVQFEPFVVNLADAGGARFLRVTLQLAVPTEADATKVQDGAVLFKRLRSALLELLAQQTSEALVTDAGKQALKKAILERASKVLGEIHVSDVFFSEFVVQF